MSVTKASRSALWCLVAQQHQSKENDQWQSPGQGLHCLQAQLQKMRCLIGLVWIIHTNTISLYITLCSCAMLHFLGHTSTPNVYSCVLCIDIETERRDAKTSQSFTKSSSNDNTVAISTMPVQLLIGLGACRWLPVVADFCYAWTSHSEVVVCSSL